MSTHENCDFVDVHVHPPTKEFLIDAGGINAEAAAQKFGHPIKLATFEEMLEEYSACGVGKLVLFIVLTSFSNGLAYFSFSTVLTQIMINATFIAGMLLVLCGVAFLSVEIYVS